MERDHKRHEITTTSMIVKEEKKRMKEMIKEFDPKVKQTRKHLSVVYAMKTHLETSLIRQKKIVNKTFDDIITQTNQKRDEIINKLELRTEKKIERIKQQIKQMERDVECLEKIGRAHV